MVNGTRALNVLL